tara:strand:- start:401 stop:757 length:357 start_codon:yes stop_codon:yes gene_type:complete
MGLLYNITIRGEEVRHMPNWEEFEYKNHSGFLEYPFDQGFIQPWTLIDWCQEKFEIELDRQWEYENALRHQKIELWDAYEGWWPYEYVTREDAWAWLVTKVDWIGTIEAVVFFDPDRT